MTTVLWIAAGWLVLSILTAVLVVLIIKGGKMQDEARERARQDEDRTG